MGDDSVMTKTCSRCKRGKPLDRFGYQKSRAGVITHRVKTVCNDCLSASSYEAHLIKKYGITVDDYQSMYQAQQGRCFLCDKEAEPLTEDKSMRSRKNRLVVDHHHGTGAIRKLLCQTCNWAVGILEVLPSSWFDRAMRYIA